MSDSLKQEGKTQVNVNSMSRRSLPQISCYKSRPPLHDDVLIQKRDTTSECTSKGLLPGSPETCSAFIKRHSPQAGQNELPSCVRPGWRGITAQLTATTQDGLTPSKDDTLLPGVAVLAYQALEQMVVLKKFARSQDHPLCHFIIKRLNLP